MRKKIPAKVKAKKKLSPLKKRVSLFACLLLVGLFIAGQFIAEERKPVVETEKNAMKKIPSDVRRVMSATAIAPTIRVPILMYHYVENIADKKDKMRVLLNVTPAVFEEQLKTLKDAGYTFLTARELGEILDGKAQLPQKPILLTFDDGHWDFDTDVLPLLKKYNIKATAYIIPGFTGGSDFMTQAQVEDVVQSGLIDVGAHTVHHIALKGRLFSTVQDEVAGSKKMLEDTYHIHVVSFAYPNGSFDQQAITIVKAAGFETAVSTIPGEDVNQTNRFFIYRLRPGYRVGNDLLTYLITNPWTAKTKDLGTIPSTNTNKTKPNS